MVTFQTFHIVKQMLVNGGGAGLGLGLRLGLRSIFVFEEFLLVVVFVLLGGPQKRGRHMLFGSCFQALRGLPHIPTSTSAREQINHVRLLVGGGMSLQHFGNIGLEVKMTRVWQTALSGRPLCAWGHPPSSPSVLICHRLAMAMVHEERLGAASVLRSA